jgi:hypothetical protein
VAISGVAQEGQTLNAVVSGNESDDSLSYQWVSSNGSTIVGTASSYLVKESDEGSTITLKVTATAEDLSGSDTKSAVTGTITGLPEGPVLGGATAATVGEGTTITVGATDTALDADDTLGSVTITGLPTDLSNFSGGNYTAGAGTWTGTADEFNALAFTAGQTAGTFNLSIAAATTGTEADTTTADYMLTVTSLTTAPSNLTLATANGNENSAIFLARSIGILTSYVYSDVADAGNTSFLQSINAAGQALGTYRDSSGIQHGFIYDSSSGKPTDITAAPPDVTTGLLDRDTNVASITDAGQVLGTYFDDNNVLVPFVYDSRTDSYIRINDPSFSGATIQGVNGSDQILGYYFDVNGKHAFLYDSASKTYTPINDPLPADVSGSLGQALNDAGQVLGSYRDGGNTAHAFVYDPSSQSYIEITDPAAAPGDSTYAQSINDSGQVLAYDVDVNSVVHSFIYDIRTGAVAVTDIADPAGVNGTIAQSMNDARQVVGYYRDANFRSHGFIYDSRTGAYSDIDDPAEVAGSAASTITDTGEVFGYYYDSNFRPNYFVYDSRSKTYAEVSDPAAVNGVSFAALGNGGKVLGSFVDSGGANVYFVYDPKTDTFADIADPAAAAGATSANGVGGTGQVVGTYTDSAGALHSFVALPSGTDETVISITVAVADNSGALLSDGTTTGTSLTVTPQHLSELRLLPPAELEGSVALRVSELVETASGPAVTVPQTLLVDVNPVAAPPILTLGSPSVTGDENAAIDLSGVINVQASDGEPTSRATASTRMRCCWRSSTWPRRTPPSPHGTPSTPTTPGVRSPQSRTPTRSATPASSRTPTGSR